MWGWSSLSSRSAHAQAYPRFFRLEGSLWGWSSLSSRSMEAPMPKRRVLSVAVPPVGHVRLVAFAFGQLHDGPSSVAGGVERQGVVSIGGPRTFRALSVADGHTCGWWPSHSDSFTTAHRRLPAGSNGRVSSRSAVPSMMHRRGAQIHEQTAVSCPGPPTRACPGPSIASPSAGRRPDGSTASACTAGATSPSPGPVNR